MHTKIIKNIDPLKLFARLDGETKVSFLHSAGKNGWPTCLAFSPCDQFIYRIGQKNNFQKFYAKNLSKKHKLIGYFSYDYGCELHKVKQQAKNDLKLPDIFFLAYQNYIEFHGKNAHLHFTDKNYPKLIEQILKRTPAKASPSPDKNFQPEMNPARYQKAYQKIKNYILEGDIYQINLTHRLKATTKQNPRQLFLKVIKENPVDFLAYIEGNNFEILSASPERFVKSKRKLIETTPIKGTRPRGHNTNTDNKNRSELLSNIKEAAELNMITDLLRNDLGKICKIGSVKVRNNRIIQKYPTVWHTYSRITGQILPEFQAIDAMISMLPGGSITGCPKKHAMEIIDELEPVTRGIYTGVIGYINPNRDIEFNIAIRTIVKKGVKLYLQVGGGIVLDSKEKAEFRETFDKARSFMKILQ